MVAAIAATLGTPLLPWQRHVADVATERLEDGRYAYRTVVVTVPRQTGKTTLLRALGVQRALLGRDVFYTAQTGKDARARWMDLVKIIRKHPALREPITTVALRGGSEHVLFPGGGVFQAFAPTADSLHGYTPPTVILDEAFAHTPALGELLMGAIKPAQQTILDKQLWLVSTKGTAESTFFHDWIDRAVEGTPGVAGFVWGATGDQDPFNLDDIAAYHPGIGFRLGDVVLKPSDILSEAEGMSAAEYVRAFGNKMTATRSNLIKAEEWASLAAARLAPPDDFRSVTLAYDVDAHRKSAAIIAVWDDPSTGLPAVKVVRQQPGSAWLADAVADLDDSRPAQLVAINSGPVLDITADLIGRGRHVTTLTDRDYAAASGAFLDRIDDGGLVHDGSDTLADSVVGLVTRSAAVDGVAFSRRHSVGRSSAAIAAVAGLHAHADEAARRVPYTRHSA